MPKGHFAGLARERIRWVPAREIGETDLQNVIGPRCFLGNTEP
jgi:hypothetical protein